MTHAEIVAMCDQTLNKKASEYATAEDRWHNFYASAELFSDFRRYTDTVLAVSPIDTCLLFALKHYTSCVDIANGKPATPEMVKEKAGDLLNYYLIYCAMSKGVVSVDTDETLTQLMKIPHDGGLPWALGYRLLKELKMNWVSVEDRSPELKDDGVLVYFSETESIETVNIMDYFKDMTCGVIDGVQQYTKWYKHKKVTHWMPLPEPPTRS